MADQRAYLRIHEGRFVFLLPAEQVLSIEQRQRTAFEPVDDSGSILAGWHVGGRARAPVIRLAWMMDFDAGDWGYAIVLSDEPRPVAVAAERVQSVAETDKPAIQPLNPIGSTLDGGPLVTGVCPSTEPEYLVLDMPRLRSALYRAADRERRS